MKNSIMPGRDPGGFIVTILLGIGGSVVATGLAGCLAGTATKRVRGSLAQSLG